MTIDITIFKHLCPYYIILLFTLIYSGCTPNKVFRLSEDIRQLPLETYQETLQKDTNHYLIDVRTPLEYNAGHFEEAINISFIGFKFRQKLNKLDRDKTVFIYCETAHRSPYTAKRLQKMGFKKVIDLKEGYKSYRKKVKHENPQNASDRD